MALSCVVSFSAKNVCTWRSLRWLNTCVVGLKFLYIDQISQPWQWLESDFSVKILLFSEMGRCLLFSTLTPLKNGQKSFPIRPCDYPTNQLNRKNLNANSESFKGSPNGFYRKLSYRALRTTAVVSEVPNRKQFQRVGAESTGSIPSKELLQVVETAAKTGAQVRNTSFRSRICKLNCSI